MYTNEVGGFVLRLVLGGIFLLHGVVKFKDGISETITRFNEYGIPFAEIAGFGVAGIETLGGFFLILGFSVRFVSFLLTGVMIGAIVFVKFEEGFFNGFEFNVALIAMSLYLLFAGSKLLSLDQLFTEKDKSSKGKIQFRN